MHASAIYCKDASSSFAVKRTILSLTCTNSASYSHTRALSSARAVTALLTPAGGMHLSPQLSDRANEWRPSTLKISREGAVTRKLAPTVTVACVSSQLAASSTTGSMSRGCLNHLRRASRSLTCHARRKEMRSSSICSASWLLTSAVKMPR